MSLDDIRVLTEQEQIAALQAAAAKKLQEIADAEARAKQEARAAQDHEAARAERRRQPLRYAGIDSGVDVSYVEFQAEKARTIHLDGRTYEHTNTDSDGVWIYRLV